MSPLAESPTVYGMLRLGVAGVARKQREDRSAGDSPKSGYPAGTRRLSVNLDEELVKRIKRAAVDRDVSLTDLVAELLQKGLAGKEGSDGADAAAFAVA